MINARAAKTLIASIANLKHRDKLIYLQNSIDAAIPNGIVKLKLDGLFDSEIMSIVRQLGYNVTYYDTDNFTPEGYYMITLI